MSCDHENPIRLDDTVFCSDCSEIILIIEPKYEIKEEGIQMNTNYPRINKEVDELLRKVKQESEKESAFDGTALEGKKRRYTIINERDKSKYLTKKEQEEFDSALFYYLGKIEEGRVKDEKEPFNSYIVINTDEPYVNTIIETMRKHSHWD